jgi:hypothetical protein
MKFTTNNLKVYYDYKRVRDSDIIDFRFCGDSGGYRYEVDVMHWFYPEKESEDILTMISKLLDSGKNHKVAIFINDKKMDVSCYDFKICNDITSYIITFMCTIRADCNGRPNNYNYDIIPYDLADYKDNPRTYVDKLNEMSLEELEALKKHDKPS